MRSECAMFIAVVLLLLVSLLHHLINARGVQFSLKESGAVKIAHTYVVASVDTSAESLRRRGSYENYLAGVPHMVIRTNASMAPNCNNTIVRKHLLCTTGHLAALKQIAADTTVGHKSFHVIFEDDMCPDKRIKGGRRMMRAIGVALARAADDALAINLGSCNGHRAVERAWSLAQPFQGSDCHILEGYGICTHAWATTQEHAKKLIGIIETKACILTVDNILHFDVNRHQHVSCPTVANAVSKLGGDMFNSNLIRQCAKESIINGP